MSNKGRFQKGWKGGPGRPRKALTDTQVSEMHQEVFVPQYTPPVPPRTGAPLEDWVDYEEAKLQMTLNGYWVKKIAVPVELVGPMLRLYKFRKAQDSTYTLAEAYVEIVEPLLADRTKFEKACKKRR